MKINYECPLLAPNTVINNVLQLILPVVPDDTYFWIADEFMHNHSDLASNALWQLSDVLTRAMLNPTIKTRVPDAALD